MLTPGFTSRHQVLTRGLVRQEAPGLIGPQLLVRLQQLWVINNLRDPLKDVKQKRFHHLRINLVHPAKVECLEVRKGERVFLVVEDGAVLPAFRPSVEPDPLSASVNLRQNC